MKGKHAKNSAHRFPIRFYFTILLRKNSMKNYTAYSKKQRNFSGVLPVGQFPRAQISLFPIALDGFRAEEAVQSLGKDTS